MDEDILPLLHGCLANDRASWNIMFRECSSFALNLLRKHYPQYSPNQHDEIISNIYTRLFDGGLKAFQGTSKYVFFGYLSRITTNEAYSYLRQNSRHSRVTSLDQPITDEDGQDTTLLDLLGDGGLDPGKVAEIEDLYRNAMAQLSIRDKQILFYKVEGYKDAEIAELLNMTTGGVAVTYNRIKELLRKTLAMVILIILFGRNLPGATSL